MKQIIRLTIFNSFFIFKSSKLASKIAKSELSYIADNVLVISTNKISRITAISITIYARKTTLNISKIKYLPEYTCNKTFGPEFSDAFLPYSINFICKSSLVRRSQYKVSNFVVVFFTSEISCETDCNYKLKKDDNVDLYEIVEDDCYKPDSPAYGHSRTWPMNRTNRSQNLFKSKNITIRSLTKRATNQTNLTTKSINLNTNNKIKLSSRTTPLPSMKKISSTINITPSNQRKSSSLITPSTTSTLTTTETSSKLPPHYYDSIGSDIISAEKISNNETETQNLSQPNSSTTLPYQISNSNETTKVETLKQIFKCNQHFKMSIDETENFDEVMEMNIKYSIKQFEMCDKNEDWRYVRLPECVPTHFCIMPNVPDNVIPSYNSLYLNEFAVVHDEITYKCLNDELDVNIGGSLQTCLTNGNWSGLSPRCVTRIKNLNLSTNNGIIYLSVSVSIVSLIILILAIYCAVKLNATANKAVQVFNEQHQQLVQQNLSVQSSLNSSIYPDNSYTLNIRQLPKVPSLYQEQHIYETVQNVVTEVPRYVDFKLSHSDSNKQQPQTWNNIQRNLKKQDNSNIDPNRVNRDSTDGYDYINLKTNESAYKRIIDNNLELNFNNRKQSTFKTNESNL